VLCQEVLLEDAYLTCSQLRRIMESMHEPDKRLQAALLVRCFHDSLYACAECTHCSSLTNQNRSIYCAANRILHNLCVSDCCRSSRTSAAWLISLHTIVTPGIWRAVRPAFAAPCARHLGTTASSNVTRNLGRSNVSVWMNSPGLCFIFMYVVFELLQR